MRIYRQGWNRELPDKPRVISTRHRLRIDYRMMLIKMLMVMMVMMMRVIIVIFPYREQIFAESCQYLSPFDVFR